MKNCKKVCSKCKFEKSFDKDKQSSREIMNLLIKCPVCGEEMGEENIPITRRSMGTKHYYSHKDKRLKWR